MNRVFLSIIFFTIFYPCVIYGGEAKFDIYAKSMKYWYDKSWGNITNVKACRITTSRQYPGGLFSCEGYLYKQVDYVYVQFQLFYRYGTVYRNYLFNYKKIEPCELMKKQRSVKYSNPLADLVLLGIKKCCPLFNHECPYYPGLYYGKNIDINGSIAPYLPPVVPVGQYKVYGRAFLDDNITIGWAEGVAIVKANRENSLTDFSMLNMG